MTTIKIKRSSEYINKVRAITILIDGKKIGTINDGETKEFTTTTGKHTIEAQIDWCGSKKLFFNINDQQSKTFKLGSFGKKRWITSISFILALTVLHLILIKTLDFYYTPIVFLPTFLFLFYYLTFGRNKYLTLNEINYDV